MTPNLPENKRTGYQVFTLAILRGWNSMVLYCYFSFGLFLVLPGLGLATGEGLFSDTFIGVIVLIIAAATGLPTAFIVGFASGILYVVSEALWVRTSFLNRILLWFGLGLLIGVATYFFGIALFQPFQWEFWVNRNIMMGRIWVLAFLLGLIFAGVTSGIDGLFLAGRGVDKYKKFAYRHLWLPLFTGEQDGLERELTVEQEEE